MSRKKIAGTSTNTILLLGAGALVLYLVMKPKSGYTGPVPPGYYVDSTGTLRPLPGGTATATLPAGSSTTNQAIASGASIVNNLINQLFG